MADGEAGLLETLLNDPEFPLPLPPVQPGEQRSGTQPKMVLTLLGYITLDSRQYLYDPEKSVGRFPLDQASGLVEGYSPAVAKHMCRAGALAGSFQAASQDLLIYQCQDAPALPFRAVCPLTPAGAFLTVKRGPHPRKD